MEFSLNITNEDFIINNNQQSLFDEDVSRIQKNHLNFFNDNFGQSSLNGWTPPPTLTDISDHYQQNLIPLIPNQNYDSLNQNFVTTQNCPVYNLPSSEIPSKYPIRGINSYSGSDTFGESMNNITNNNKNYMACNTSISLKPKGLFNNFHDFRGNTMWVDTIHNDGLITSGYQSALNNIMIESHPFDLPVQEGIKTTAREITNWRQDQVMVKTNHNKDKEVVTRCKPLRKANIIKEKWTHEEDIKLVEKVELYGTKNWGMIAKMLEGRVGKQCRERWCNHLRPNIKKGAWTEEEDQILVEAHKVTGNKWIEIAQQLPGRSENTIKNHWNATKRRMHLMKTKKSDENANPPHNILENYIMYVAINNDPPKTTETADTKDDDIFDGEMNSSMNITTKTIEPLDPSTSSDYVLEPAMFSWENYFTEFCESMDDTYKLKQGWE